MAEMKESRTALGVAWMRALHQVLDAKPLILEDEPIVELLGRYYVERASQQTERFQSLGSRLLRSHVVLRSRFTEDRLEQSLSRGVEQFVILGAGYDTFFARQPAWARSLRIFEIDQPATAADKLARISAARMNVPANAVFGNVNFETESVADGLRRHGVRFDRAHRFLMARRHDVPDRTRHRRDAEHRARVSPRQRDRADVRHARTTRRTGDVPLPIAPSHGRPARRNHRGNGRGRGRALDHLLRTRRNRTSCVTQASR